MRQKEKREDAYGEMDGLTGGGYGGELGMETRHLSVGRYGTCVAHLAPKSTLKHKFSRASKATRTSPTDSKWLDRTSGIPRRQSRSNW